MNEWELIISARFNGPPETANGGFVAGLLAKHIGRQAEINLRKPPPLNRELTLTVGVGKEVELHDQKTLIALGRPTSLKITVPSPPSFKEALKAESNYSGFRYHAFPTCFVCGPDREIGDGLRIFPGALPDENAVAATWKPDLSTGTNDGFVALEYIWAVLDCPGYFAVAGKEQITAVLGHISADIISHPFVGESCIIMGWSLGRVGRKRFAGTALFSADGKLYGRARATWYDIQNI